jgi:hypothetical protein
MESSWMQANYRAIFTEMLLAQSAATGAFADVAARCALLTGQQYQQALVMLARKMTSKGGVAEPAHPGGGSGIPGASPPKSANFGRAFAGLPRVSMMIFLSQYDNLRGRRGVVRD